MKLTIRITRNTITFTAPSTVVEGQTDYEQYNMKPGIAVAANLRQAIAQCRLTQATEVYDTATAVVDTPLMLTPEEEYDEMAASILYHHANSQNRQDDVLAYPITQLGVVATFAANKDLMHVLDETFRSVQIVPLLAPVLIELARRSYGGYQEKMFCYFHDKRVDVCAFRKGRLRFCSPFDTATPQDAAYYILNVWQTLAMRPTDILCLAGNINGLEALAKDLRRFVKNVKQTGDI